MFRYVAAKLSVQEIRRAGVLSIAFTIIEQPPSGPVDMAQFFMRECTQAVGASVEKKPEIRAERSRQQHCPTGCWRGGAAKCATISLCRREQGEQACDTDLSSVFCGKQLRQASGFVDKDPPLREAGVLVPIGITDQRVAPALRTRRSTRGG